MRRHVESLPKVSPVDAHERARDYLSEEEFALLLQGTVGSRYRWRNTAMLMLTFYHGLRVTELCRLKRQDVQTPPIDPLRQWSLKPTGLFQEKLALGIPHFSLYNIAVYYRV